MVIAFFFFGVAMHISEWESICMSEYMYAVGE